LVEILTGHRSCGIPKKGGDQVLTQIVFGERLVPISFNDHDLIIIKVTYSKVFLYVQVVFPTNGNMMFNKD